MEIKHTLREGNHCADFLAKLGASNDVVLRTHEDPPQGLSWLLSADRAGVAFLRG